MERNRFDEYITRFNAQDLAAFDEFLTEDMTCLNGALVIRGVQGFRAHYQKIWSTFVEELQVERFVSDDAHVAIEMRTHFTARHDDPASMFGPVKKDQTYDFHGVIMYDLVDGRFASIQVAYNSFAGTSPDGVRTELGIPH